jgi:hypothetical protein
MGNANERTSTASEWERVDERVLHWVATLPPSRSSRVIYDFRSNSEEPGPIEGLTPPEIDRSLRRLHQERFVNGQCDPLGRWWRLRLGPVGLVYLGEWPDVELVTSAAMIHRVLRAIAEIAPAGEKDAVTRAAGVVGRTVDGVVRDTLGEIAHDVGSELAE